MDYITDSFLLFWSYLNILVSDFEKWKLFNDEGLYLAIIAFLYFLIPVLLLYLLKKRVFRSGSNKYTIFFTVLSYLVFFSPLLTQFHPNFHKDIAITKLQPPLTQKKYLLLKGSPLGRSVAGDFRQLENKLVKRSFNESIVFIDSLQLGEKEVIYFQKNSSTNIVKEKIDVIDNGLYYNETIFLLGTDHLGRDLFAMLLSAAKVSFFIAVASLLIASAIGITLGFLAGYYEGYTNIIISRISDLILTFPSLFLVFLILALFGNNTFSVIIVLGTMGSVSLFKIVKVEILSIKNKDFIKTSKMIGFSNYYVFRKDILPNIASPIIINLLFLLTNVILVESTLSFLGLGASIDTISLGSMIQHGQEYMQNAWWMIFWPSLILIISLFTFNSLAEKLNIKLNPNLKND